MTFDQMTPWLSALGGLAGVAIAAWAVLRVVRWLRVLFYLRNQKINASAGRYGRQSVEHLIREFGFPRDEILAISRFPGIERKGGWDRKSKLANDRLFLEYKTLWISN